ncbi:MAG TPA: hypothetical protein V6D16_20315, partial [Candidatus Obscuribacterales bacterium]
EYGCDIVLSEFTYELCRDRIWVRELDKIRVKGKNRPVSIFELIGDRREALPADSEEFLDLYIAGRTAYKQMEFQQALKYFNAAQELRDTDQAVEVHLRRIQDYLTNPPPEDWDGVHTMTSK